jgi:hypothetical protein
LSIFVFVNFLSYSQKPAEVSLELLDGNIIRDRITPKRGRFVLFDGSILHSSSTSTLSPRIIINNNIRLPIKGDA